VVAPVRAPDSPHPSYSRRLIAAIVSQGAIRFNQTEPNPFWGKRPEMELTDALAVPGQAEVVAARQTWNRRPARSAARTRP
jgi:hypothetical protein